MESKEPDQTERDSWIQRTDGQLPGEGAADGPTRNVKGVRNAHGAPQKGDKGVPYSPGKAASEIGTTVFGARRLLESADHSVKYLVF